MVKVRALLRTGVNIELEYPDSFFDAAMRLHVKGRRGQEIVAELIDHDWPAPLMIVDVILNGGQPGAKSLRLWC